MSSRVLNGREVTVPVPWGEIRGREWGTEDGVPWIALHGWSDNAGTFEPLVPLFPQGHRLLCIDLPGHGLSSHIPPGHGYHFLENLEYVQRVARHQGWDSFGLLGHSMGAGIASLYAATFPEKIKALIMIDLIKPVSRRTDELVERTRNAVEGRLDFEAKAAARPEKVYPTFEKALERLIDGSTFLHGKDNVTEESARIMLQRGAREVDGGWQFTRDRRLQVTSLYGLPPDFLLEFCRSIRCPHLLVKANSQAWDTEELNRAAVEAYCTNPLYEYRAVPGPHHVHLNNPEIVAGPIAAFLERHNNLDGTSTSTDVRTDS